METMQPALKNGRNVYDMINMPKEEFNGRIERVRAAMAERGIDLLLVYTTGLTDYGDVAYLTNFVIRLPRGQLVAVPKNGEVVTFFEGSSRGLTSLRLTLSLGDLVAVGDLPEECLKYLKEKGWIPGSIGLAGLRSRMPYQQFRAIAAGLEGCTVKDAGDILVDFRSIKSPREVDQIRRAARIAGRLTLSLKEGGFDRPNERAVEASLYRAARSEGAEDFRMLLATPGQTGLTFRPTDNRPLEEDGKVVIYLAVEFERYWAASARTFIFKAGSFVDEKGGESLAASLELCKTLKSGASISDLSVLLGGRGVDALRPYGLGSGIGLGLNEAPFLEKETPSELREGMVLSLRVAIPRNDETYSVMGNTFLVDRDGGLILTVEQENPGE
jgi:Xaa-Pro dipeptidase